MLVRGEDLDRFARVLCRLLGNGIRELFLNAAASSGVADFGFFGRGFWIDQPIAFNASQPRCGATEVRLSSPAIQAATLRLDHSPPSGGGSSRRRRNLASRSGFKIVAGAPLRRRKSPRASGPSAYCSGRAIVRSIARHRRRPRHLRDGVTTRQKPDYLEVPRCGGILTSDKPLFQLLDTQMIPDRRHVSQSSNSWRLSLSASHGRVNPFQRRVNQPETV